MREGLVRGQRPLAKQEVFGVLAQSFEWSKAKGVLLLFNKEDISKMRIMLTEDWVEIPDDGRWTIRLSSFLWLVC